MIDRLIFPGAFKAAVESLTAGMQDAKARAQLVNQWRNAHADNPAGTLRLWAAAQTVQEARLAALRGKLASETDPRQRGMICAEIRIVRDHFRPPAPSELSEPATR